LYAVTLFSRWLVESPPSRYHDQSACESWVPLLKVQQVRPVVHTCCYHNSWLVVSASRQKLQLSVVELVRTCRAVGAADLIKAPQQR
jgi:hypothetical protein